MADYAHIRAVKEAAQPGLLALPGVHAVAVGAKRVNGQPTDEPAIAVFLVKKLPLAELPPGDVVPPEIDGVKTDVIEMAVPRPHQDLDRTWKRPLTGGVTIQTKGQVPSGTLGCFALTSDPQPKVVAITCQHVIAPPVGRRHTDVTVATPALGQSPNPYKISFSVPSPVSANDTTTGSLIVVKMQSPSRQTAFNAYWTVTASDTDQTIAQNVMAAVNAIAGSGVTAAIGQTPDVLMLTTASGFDTKVLQCSVYDPLVPDSEVKLAAEITGNVITLSGKVDGDYGVYVSWNTDGSDPTRGVFTAVPDGTAVAAVPGVIAVAVTNLVTKLKISNIATTYTTTTVTIAGAAQVSCIITRDDRVGSPTDSFSSNCSLCCSNHIGQVIAAQVEFDAALVQLRTKITYLNKTWGDGKTVSDIAITGAHDVTGPEAHGQYPVRKHGAKTGYTTGTVAHLGMAGYTTEYPKNRSLWEVFYRYYQGAMTVMGDDSLAFSDFGDSGAAVVDMSGNVVGIVFGGGGSASEPSLVTPIAAITNAFNVTIATAQTPVPQTVTQAQGAPAVVVAADDEVIRQVVTAQAEIAATPVGKRYTELVGRHAREVQNLVNNNLRVAVVWHRNGGPQIARAALRYLGHPGERLPQEIDGVPLTERLTRIRDALMRYGSAELSGDLARYGSELLDLTGLSYPEALERMRVGRAGVR